jgi:hypothetical protein
LTTVVVTLFVLLFASSFLSVVGDTLDTIKLPEGWVFENPKEKITKDTKEVSVKYSKIDGKVGTALINVQERAQIIAGENSFSTIR